jgi:ribosomal-protein-alanine N-acetyltransferase
MRTATKYVVRPMRLSDISQVMEVERESFPTMWPPTAFKRELQQNRLARYTVLVEHDPSRVPAIPMEPAPQPAPRGLGRLFGEIRHLLVLPGKDEDEDKEPLPPIAERPELVAGFLGVWMMADEAHIVTVAVRESHRRRGLGELLVISSIDMARMAGQGLMTLECRVSNEAALALYEKYGFDQVGLRPRYYSDNHEDAYVLTLSSLMTQRYQERLEERRAEHARRWGEFEFENA